MAGTESDGYRANHVSLMTLVREGVRRLVTPPRAAVEPPNEDPENPDNWFGLDYVHDAVASQLEQQAGLWEEASGRLRLVLGVSGLVFAVTLGLLPRTTVGVTTASGLVSQLVLLPFWVGALAIAGLALFFVAGLIATIAYWPRNFSWPPAPDSLRKYLTTDPREIKLIVVDEMIEAYARNAVELDSKVLAVRRSLAISALATALLGAALIIDVLTYTQAWGS
jgi:hypothetical protein